MEMEKETLELNTLRINLEGDGSAIKHILSKLFDCESDDQESDYKYNKVDEELEGLEVNVRVSQNPRNADPKPHAVIMAVDLAAEEPINIEEGLEKHNGTITTLLIINNQSIPKISTLAKKPSFIKVGFKTNTKTCQGHMQLKISGKNIVIGKNILLSSQRPTMKTSKIQ